MDIRGTLQHTLQSVRQAPGRLTQGIRQATRLPAVAVMKSRAAAHEAFSHWNGVVRSEPRPAHKAPPPPVRLVAKRTSDGIDFSKARPATARDVQNQGDKRFRDAHRAELASGQYWAMRGQDGQLHLLRHSNTAADMFSAVDRSMRVEKGQDSADYLQGAGQGAAQSVVGTVSGLVGAGKVILKTVTTDPRVSLRNAAEGLRKSQGGAAAVKFSRNSTEIALAAASGLIKKVEEAHRDPRTAGQLHGQVGAEVLQAGMPPWASVGFWLISRRGRQVAESGRDALKAADAVADIPVGKMPGRTSLTRFWGPHHPAHTRPTGRIGGTPTGSREIGRKSIDATTKRALQRQNEAIDLLAARGYRVEHRPTNPLHPEKKPDVLVEGRIFDVKSPSSDNARSIYTHLRKDIELCQTRRAIINLEDSPLSIEQMQQQFQEWPLLNLEEVIVIKRGVVAHIYP